LLQPSTKDIRSETAGVYLL